MTQAQMMQSILLADMFRRLTNCTDSELMEARQNAVELRDGRFIKQIQNELNRRVREI